MTAYNPVRYCLKVKSAFVLLRPLFALLIIFALCSPAKAVETIPPSKIAELKAVYFFNALKFTRWPDQHSEANKKLRIVIIGSDDTADVLVKRLPNKTIQGQAIEIIPIAIDALSQPESKQLISSAQAAYFAKNSKRAYPAILESIQQPTLTSSCIEGFALKGGMIEISENANKTKLIFNINATSVKDSNLKIISQLMLLANIIDRQSSIDNEAIIAT